MVPDSGLKSAPMPSKGIEVQQHVTDSVIPFQVPVYREPLPQVENQQHVPDGRIGDRIAASQNGVYQSNQGAVSAASSNSTSYGSARSSSSSPFRQNTQDSLTSSISSVSAGSISNLSAEFAKEDSDPTIIPLEITPLIPYTATLTEAKKGETPSSTALSSTISNLDLFRAEVDPTKDTVARPSLPSRAFSWDENDLDDESLMNVVLPSQRPGSRDETKSSVWEGKQPVRPQSHSLSPLHRGQKVIHQPSSSSSGMQSTRGRTHYLVPHTASFRRPQSSYFVDPSSSISFPNRIYEFPFEVQPDVEPDALLLERLQTMEDDRLLAEELQRIEEEDSHQALNSRKWQDELETEELLLMEEREEKLRLEELERIASEDALLAAAIVQQEQEDYEAEQRREQERLAQEERARQEALEKERQRQALLERSKIGAPVSVRRVSNWGALSDGNLDELTPEIVKHLKEAKDLFTRNLPSRKVKKIEWIINPKLEEQFENTRRTLQRYGHPTTELILFHGTAPANIEPYTLHTYNLTTG